jgi:hypothetical protein
VPRRNRVTPLSDLEAVAARGLVYGNRGCLHDRDGRIVRHHAGRRWIACRLAFKDRRRALMQPGRYTELFFLDEATALAAGHRPCAECRRADYDALVALWAALHSGAAPAGADAIDARLHAERLKPDDRTQRRHEAEIADVPDGTFVLRDGAPWLVRGPDLRRWTPRGYADRVPRPARGAATVVTPPSLVALLRTERAPLVPFLHPSATG